MKQSNDRQRLLLNSGIEVRSYSLTAHGETLTREFVERSKRIMSTPLPYDPKVDLVGQDLKVTPAVLYAIDRGKW